MTMQLITAPELEPVTLADARSFLRIDTSADDEILQKLLTTAREMVETRTGLALITQSWQLKIARWPRSGRLALYRFPVQMILQKCICSLQTDRIAYVLQNVAIHPILLILRLISPQDLAAHRIKYLKPLNRQSWYCAAICMKIVYLLIVRRILPFSRQPVKD